MRRIVESARRKGYDREVPREFADLEPFGATWSLSSDTERFERRLAGAVDEIPDFYDAFFPRLEEAIDYCAKLLPMKDPRR